MVKFELPVAFIEELTFSGWVKLFDPYLDDLLRESVVMGSCPIAEDYVGNYIELSVFKFYWVQCIASPSPRLIIRDDSDLSSWIHLIAFILCFC